MPLGTAAAAAGAAPTTAETRRLMSDVATARSTALSALHNERFRAALDQLFSPAASDGMMQMREADGLVVPAHGSVQLAPGGYHLMLMNLQQPLREGQSAELSFVLDDGTRVKATFPVRSSAP